jgi:amino acid adenylation domain-containing protein
VLDPTRLADGAWLIRGVLDLGLTWTRCATAPLPLCLAVHDLPDETSWGELVRGEVEAARVDGSPARVALARASRDEHLAIVVTRDGVDPRSVLAWMLDPATAIPAAGSAEVDGRCAVPDEVELPAALRGGGRPSGSASSLRRPCGPEFADFAIAAGVSLEAVLAAAVAILLARYRSRPDVDLLVSTPRRVAVSIRLDEHEWVRDLVRRTEKGIRAGAPVPSGCDATVAVGTGPGEPETIGSYAVTPVHVPDGRAQHELAVALTERELRIDYDAGLFDGHAVATFADRLTAVLAEVMTDCRVRDIDALAAGERAALDAWSRGEIQPVEDVCLHTLIERHAAATPDAVAVVCGAAELTYGELNARANRVAHRLLADGPGRGNLVAVLAGRSTETVVAMLGVLKSGAAYVPVEPSYPAERIRHIVTDAGAVQLPAPAGDEPSHNPNVPVTPDDLAYVIYTSGSTGVPKGVAVSHRSIMVSTHARGIGGRPPERDLVTMPLCFDGAAGGLYWTLTGGGTAVLPTELEAHDPGLMRALLHRVPVTHIHSVPSHYGLVLQAMGGTGLEALRLVSVGGEPMPPKLVARHLLDCPDAVLLNDYGPTECAVWATAHRCGIADATAAKVPIGGPLPNYRVHVLDTCLRPVPPGLPGEIYLGGPAVARGYHRGPGLTAERFVPDPFGAAGARLYRTGDRGYWSAGGELHIIGRVDNQVKLRGFRVELGEIEAAVRRHRAVADCAVTVGTTAGGTDQVVAFVASGDPALTDADLLGEVARLLPAYMHPDRFVVLPELPRLPSGKLDAQRLRTVELS